jgi:hypothetical protein
MQNKASRLLEDVDGVEPGWVPHHRHLIIMHDPAWPALWRLCRPWPPRFARCPAAIVHAPFWARERGHATNIRIRLKGLRLFKKVAPFERFRFSGTVQNDRVFSSARGCVTSYRLSPGIYQTGCAFGPFTLPGTVQLCSVHRTFTQLSEICETIES